MAATVTLDKVLQLAAKLSGDEQEKLVREMKRRQRKHAAWLQQLDKDAKRALADCDPSLNIRCSTSCSNFPAFKMWKK